MLKPVPKLNLSIPDHTILDKIGEGGMSAVYLGRQISLQRKVAIKVLKKLVMDDKSLAERFVDEAKTVASLDHPHIISIYEAKKLPSGLAYFTMPYLTHGDFGEIICTNSDHLIELLCQICDGLSHAHKHGVIHRDLKPENILFDQFGRIKIADFGIAISKNVKRKTKETQLLGSAHYMSPEQIQSKEIDHHSDIYSLGCIIYEKLTGDHVFQAGNDFSILMSHINKPIPQLPKVLTAWQPIINQCLAKAPEDRFQTVEEVKDALLEIKYNKHKDAGSLNQTDKSNNGTRKKIMLIAAASVMLVSSIGLIFNLYQNKKPHIDSANSNMIDNPQTSGQSNNDGSGPNNTTEPLSLSVGIVENKPEAEVETELIDLTGNLDNDQINEMSIEVTLKEAQELLKKYRLTKPKGENAADKFQKILLEQPDHKEARKGLNQIGSLYFRLIDKKLVDQDTTDALKHTQSLVNYINNYHIDRSLFDKQVSQIMSMVDTLVSSAIFKRRKNAVAEDYLKMADLLVPDYDFINELKKQYKAIPSKGDILTDASGQHFIFMPVEGHNGMRDFMLGQSEITVAQFAEFAGEQFTDVKCHHYDKRLFFKKTWAKPPFEQNNNHPVVCVSYEHAQAYASWLSAKTGAKYRIPTAQEWLYSNQQVMTHNNCQSANLAGSEVKDENKATDTPLDCQDGYVFTAPIQSFPATINLNDLNGNVSEWVSQCPENESCAAGSSWRSGQAVVDNTYLKNLASDETHSDVGFRLIKEF